MWRVVAGEGGGRRQWGSVAHGSVALDVIEAAYELEATDEAWSAALVAAAKGHFDRGLGLYLSVYEEHRPERPLLVLWDPPELAALSAAFLARLPDAVQRYFLENTNYSSLRGILRGLDEAAEQGWLEVAAPFRIRDAIGLVAHDLEGRSLQLCGCSPRDETPRRAESDTWSRVAAHLGAALRLRNRWDDIDHEFDAVLTPSGRLEHARGDVAASPGLREALTDAVKRRERVRARGRLDGEANLLDWPALVRGRYSLVDAVDANGTRRVMAPHNAPSVDLWLRLSPTQRTMVELVRRGLANKQIAYALGVTEGHVGATLHAAMQRLGVGSRVELALFARHSSNSADVRRSLATRLSPAEVEVAMMALTGSTHRAIAHVRGVSERTVANQLASVYRVFGVRSKAELAARVGGEVVRGA